jgi:integrase
MSKVYKERNRVQLQENSRGYLQYQIPGAYAEAIYGKKQKYISFGAKAGDIEVSAEAKQKLKILQKDLDQGLFDDKSIGKYKYNKKQVKYSYQKTQKFSLVELFERYRDYRFNKDNETGIHCYNTRYKSVLKSCPQQDFTSVSQQWEIVEYIKKIRQYGTVCKIFSVLDNAVKREKLTSNLPENTPNIFRKALEDFKKNNKEKKRDYPLMLIQRGYVKDQDKRAWNAEEVEIILDAWRTRNKKTPYYRGCDVKAMAVEFLFNTGMRHGEAYGLQWSAVSEDFSSVLIHKSFSKAIKSLKGTKTGKNRKINLNLKAKRILQELKNFYTDMGMSTTPSSFVFMKENAKPYITTDFVIDWTGASKSSASKITEKIGIVPRLVIDGKLNNYIDMYSTRRTFVSLQAQAGVDPKTVADYIGDNVETILKHYYQGKEDYVPLDLL